MPTSECEAQRRTGFPTRLRVRCQWSGADPATAKPLRAWETGKKTRSPCCPRITSPHAITLNNATFSSRPRSTISPSGRKANSPAGSRRSRRKSDSRSGCPRSRDLSPPCRSPARWSVRHRRSPGRWDRCSASPPAASRRWRPIRPCQSFTVSSRFMGLIVLAMGFQFMLTWLKAFFALP